MIRNSEVTWGENKPFYYGYALEAMDVVDLKLINFKGTHAKGNNIESISIK